MNNNTYTDDAGIDFQTVMLFITVICWAITAFFVFMPIASVFMGFYQPVNDFLMEYCPFLGHAWGLSLFPVIPAAVGITITNFFGAFAGIRPKG